MPSGTRPAIDNTTAPSSVSCPSASVVYESHHGVVAALVKLELEIDLPRTSVYDLGKEILFRDDVWTRQGQETVPRDRWKELVEEVANLFYQQALDQTAYGFHCSSSQNHSPSFLHNLFEMLSRVEQKVFDRDSARNVVRSRFASSRRERQENSAIVAGIR